MLSFNKNQLRKYLLTQRKTPEHQHFIKAGGSAFTTIHEQLTKKLQVLLAAFLAIFLNKKSEEDFKLNFNLKPSTHFNIASYQAISGELAIDISACLSQAFKNITNNIEYLPSIFKRKIHINHFLPYAFKDGRLEFRLYQIFEISQNLEGLEELFLNKVFQAELTLDEYNIPSPDQNIEQNIKKNILKTTADDLNIVIIPAVGIYKFQENLHRIGYGAGFYDRFFSNLKNQKHKPLLIAINHDWQQKIYDIDEAKHHATYDLVMDIVL